VLTSSFDKSVLPELGPGTEYMYPQEQDTREKLFLKDESRYSWTTRADPSVWSLQPYGPMIEGTFD
jgi:hypothetical protein